MILWYALQDLLGAMLFGLAHVFGGSLGAAILALPLMLRLLLLPLNLRLARIQQANARVFAELRPELERLRTKYAKQPDRLAAETRRLLDARGVSLFSPRAFFGTLAQWPIWLALFFVVQRAAQLGGRFLWIRDLARPDPILALVATATTYVGISISSVQSPTPVQAMAIGMGLVTLLFVSRAAAGVGLYWAASGLVSILQAALLRRTAVRPAVGSA